MTPLEKCARAIEPWAFEPMSVHVSTSARDQAQIKAFAAARACLESLKEVDPAAKDKATVGGWLEVECGFDEMWNTYIDHILSQ